MGSAFLDRGRRLALDEPRMVRDVAVQARTAIGTILGYTHCPQDRIRTEHRAARGRAGNRGEDDGTGDRIVLEDDLADSSEHPLRKFDHGVVAQFMPHGDRCHVASLWIVIQAKLLTLW